MTSERRRSKSFEASGPTSGKLSDSPSPWAAERQQLFNRFEGNGERTEPARRHLRTRWSLGLSSSGYYRSDRTSLESRPIRKEVLELSAKHPRYQYRRITASMRREGFEVNGKRVSRIRRDKGIKVSNATPNGGHHRHASGAGHHYEADVARSSACLC